MIQPVGDREIVAGAGGLVALDAHTGSVLWRKTEPAGVAADAWNGVVYLSSRNGSVLARSARDGTLIWETPRVCSMKSPSAGGVQIVKRFGDDLIAACAFGELVRLDVRTGAVLARAGFELENFNKIERIGSCSYAISGSESGAILRFYSGLVQCKSLETILPLQQDLRVLGEASNQAVLDDRSCGGTGNRDCPDVISHLDLATGMRSDGVNLTGKSSQASSAMLVGRHLYLFLGTPTPGPTFFAIDDYGDPLAPDSTPHRVADNVIGYVVTGNLVAGVQTNGRDASDARYILLALNDGTAKPLWSFPAIPYGVVPNFVSSGGGYLEPRAPLAVSFLGANNTTFYVRLGDLKVLVPDRDCVSVQADDRLVILNCPTKRLVGRVYVTYLAAYAW